MLADRGQKSRALRYVVARDWFPQLELDVTTTIVTGERSFSITDVDLYAVVPDALGTHRAVLVDCKTRKGESPIARGLWQKGIMDYLSVERGICILRKSKITNDHRLSADTLGVTLLNDEEFEEFAKATAPHFARLDAAVAEIALWDKYFELTRVYPKLVAAKNFAKSEFWMLRSESEACRRSLYVLRKIAKELDPDKPEHCAIVADLSALFMAALSRLVRRVFSGYLLPETRESLSNAMLILLYGGKEAYDFRNDLVQRAYKKGNSEGVSSLALPEWDRFLKLSRQLLDAPLDTQYSALILREVAFEYFSETGAVRQYLKSLARRHGQAARFSVLAVEYAVTACKLPSDFAGKINEQIFRALAGDEHSAAGSGYHAITQQQEGIRVEQSPDPDPDPSLSRESINEKGIQPELKFTRYRDT